MMFEESESDPCLSDIDRKKLEATLRVQLLLEQYRHLSAKDESLVIFVSGIDGAGKTETINLLTEWMDPRHIHTVAFPDPSPDELLFPRERRLWMSLPPKGSIGIIYGAGYVQLIEQALKKKPNHDKLASDILYLKRLEANLAANGVRILKLWFHLSQNAQRARTKALLANPSTAWQVAKADKKVFKNFEKLREAGARIIEATDTPYAPWIVIPSADANLRAVRTAQAVLQALKRPSAKVPPLHDPGAPILAKTHKTALDRIDYNLTLEKDVYEVELLSLQNQLAQLVRSEKFKNRSLALVFEGNDAAGKGGTIRRITRAIDARQYSVMAVIAPTREEQQRPYLWRFWQNIPRHGRIAIFDRSWYGRVLVERVEKLIKKIEWTRAYGEINDFEQHLVNHGTIVLKFWLAVSSDEQLRRFREREQSPFKQFKLTDEDWRNRSKSKAYALAARDMFDHTDTVLCPWHVLSANDKKYARIEVLKIIVHALESALNSSNDL